MDCNLRFLKTCGCLSLRAGTIYIGIIELLFYTTLLFNDLVISIIYVHVMGGELKLQLYSITELMLLGVTVCLHVIFDIYLLYGTIWNSPRRSSFILTWLLLKAAAVCSIIIEVFTESMLRHGLTMLFFAEGGLYFVFQLFSIFIVYNYYKTLPSTVL